MASCSSSSIVDHTFVPNVKLGITMPQKSDRIAKVEPGTQAALAGVVAGWRILRIAGKMYSIDELAETASGDTEYTITFNCQESPECVGPASRLEVPQGGLVEYLTFGADAMGSAEGLTLTPIASSLASYSGPADSARLARCAKRLRQVTIAGLTRGAVSPWVTEAWPQERPRRLNLDGQWPTHGIALDHALGGLFIAACHLPTSLSTPDERGLLPLQLAARKKSPRLVSLLLCARAPADMKSKEDGRTALHDAAQAGDVNCVNLLLQARAHPEVRDHLRRVPIELASRMGHAEVQEAILQHADALGSAATGEVTCGRCVGESQQCNLM